MVRLNVVTGDDDTEMSVIRKSIGVFETAFGLPDVIAVLRRHAERGHRTDTLDAIGHSCSHGFLIIGNWVIDESPQTAASFGELLRPYLRQLCVRTIRLLGCSTATTERGRNAIHRVARVTGCRVFGTKRYISKNDYGTAGFVSDETLVDANGASFDGSRFARLDLPG